MDNEVNLRRVGRVEQLVRPYLPANGTEGMCFFERWCSHCARDKAMREGANLDDCDDDEKCQIIADSFCGPVQEWIEDGNGPRCTKFVPAGEPIPPPRCTKTVDMFVPPNK